MDNQSKIKTFLYNLNTENYAAADKELAQVIKNKLNARFQEAYARAEQNFAKHKRGSK